MMLNVIESEVVESQGVLVSRLLLTTTIKWCRRTLGIFHPSVLPAVTMPWL